MLNKPQCIEIIDYFIKLARTFKPSEVDRLEKLKATINSLFDKLGEMKSHV